MPLEATPLTIGWALFAFLALAPDACAQGSIERGRALVDTHRCAACHSDDDLNTADVPYIDGQKIYYLNRQITEFHKPRPPIPTTPSKLNERHHSVMQQPVLHVSESDIRDISEYLANRPCLPVREVGAASEPAKNQRCVYCHGAKGVNPYDIVPNIGGQKRQYLIDELTKFRASALDRPGDPNHDRFHRLMASATYDLTNQEIVEFADYYSQQSCRLSR